MGRENSQRWAMASDSAHSIGMPERAASHAHDADFLASLSEQLSRYQLILRHLYRFFQQPLWKIME